MKRIALLLLALVTAGPAYAQSASTPFHLVATNSTNATVLKPRSGIVVAAQLSGLSSAPAYVKFYDKATAPTCGTDTPKKVLMIPAASTAANGGGSNVTISLGTVFNVGIGICVVTGIADSDNTAVAAATFLVDIDWQ